LGGVFMPLTAFAADPANPDGSFNIIVTPQPVSLVTKPGTTTSTDLRVQNQSLGTEHVKITLMKFSAEGESGTPRLIEFADGETEKDWVSFSRTHFDAQPNIWETIKMTIKVPKTAAFGYYYAVVFSRDGAEQQTQAGQANLLGAVATLVLLDVDAPGAVQEAKIVNFSSNRKLYEFLPADFNVRVHNSGNVHVAPRGNIFITKGGKQVAILEVNLNKGFVLPGTYRKFATAWADGTPVYKIKTADGKVVLDKNSKPEKALDWANFSPDKLRFGKYTARLVMVYNDGQGDVSVEAKLSFWVIPWRIIGVLLVVFILLAAGLWALIGRPLRKRLRKRSVETEKGEKHGPKDEPPAAN
jgi:hypothetical protein